MRYRRIDVHRETTYKTILGVTATVVIWAIVHDQYLVRIAPEHFTEYHKPLRQTKAPSLLAFLYAVGASTGPGLSLGLATTHFGRNGTKKQIPANKLILGSVLVVIATELVSLSSGLIVFLNKKAFYPTEWFPDLTLPIQVAQTIQITAYTGAFFFSVIFLFTIHFHRCTNSKR